MAVPAVITLVWLLVILEADDSGMLGFGAVVWLAMIVPALLVAWLK